MSIFQSKEQMRNVLGTLHEKLAGDPVVGPKYLKANIVIKYNITDPNDTLWLTPGDGSKGEVFWGQSDLKPDIEYWLTADTSHKFWMREISLPIAIAKGLVKTKGSLPKVLKLLPLLKPAYEMYPELARSQGVIE